MTWRTHSCVPCRDASRLYFFALTLALACSPTAHAQTALAVIQEHCSGCHGAGKAAGDLSKVTNAKILDRVSLPSGRPKAMPPSGPRLTGSEISALRTLVWPKHDEHDAVKSIHDRILAKKSSPGPYTVTIPNTTVSYSMVPIPAGDFVMSGIRKVHLDAFWMQTHEVTWDEYRLFMFANQANEGAHKDETVDAVSRPTRPYAEMSFGMGLNGFPAISMTQHAANKYAEWLSAKTGEFYRLPTEAEWEYACRADQPEPAPSPLDAAAWYAANSGGKYQKVASKKPNVWGLYDMLGNVMEWTLDAYEPYRTAPANNPWVIAQQPYPHAVRGGSWNDPPDQVTCTARVASDPSWKQQDPQLPKSIWYMTDAQWLGFRLVRPLKIPSATDMYRYWNNGVEHDEQ